MTSRDHFMKSMGMPDMDALISDAEVIDQTSKEYFENAKLDLENEYSRLVDKLLREDVEKVKCYEKLLDWTISELVEIAFGDCSTRKDVLKHMVGYIRCRRDQIKRFAK